MKIKNRIKSKQDFQSLIRTGQVKKNNEFVIYYKNNELGYLRLGVSSPKKLGNAVTRSTIRRQIRQLVAETINLDRPLDIIVVARLNYNHIDNYLHNKESLAKLINSIGD